MAADFTDLSVIVSFLSVLTQPTVSTASRRAELEDARERQMLTRHEARGSAAKDVAACSLAVDEVHSAQGEALVVRESGHQLVHEHDEIHPCGLSVMNPVPPPDQSAPGFRPLLAPRHHARRSETRQFQAQRSETAEQERSIPKIQR